MYLYRFGMKKLPFGLTPDTELFCPLRTHVEALNVIAFALNSGEALIKITGEVGLGKTMLCRRLLNRLHNRRKVAYIPNPKVNARELKFSLAKELGVRITQDCREDQLTQRIQTRLLNLNKTHGAVVLVIDEAQQLTEEGLETLRLFTNIETETQKLLQIVLFGQPELDRKLERSQLRQIKQRIVFSYHLNPLTEHQINRYVTTRLKLAQSSLDEELSTKYGFLSNWLVTHYSRGIPRLINILCHKSLLLCFSKGKQRIKPSYVIQAAMDTEAVNTKILDRLPAIVSILALLASTSVAAYWGLA